MLFHVFGSINAFFICLSVFGVVSQWITIRKRQTHGIKATELISLNQFAVSFLTYFAFFVYGYSIEPFNHYMVWSRLVAALFALVIVLEIYRERRTSSSFICSITGIVLMMFGIVGLCKVERFYDEGRVIGISLMLIMSALLAQGYLHQIKLIIRSGKTGAVDLRMSQFILMMDISTLAFACVIGLKQGWALLVLAGTSAITKVVIMYLFYWVKVSSLARQRRLNPV